MSALRTRRGGAPGPRARGGLVAFLGPSLPAAEARRLAPCTVLPPARQGDVWRALALRPRAIALVDGVFGSVPSVWHHELLDALDAGVAVFGGGSMGALRAAELAPHGVVGVGRVFAWYRDGALAGDDEVALLHAGADLGFRPLTLPLVNVRAAAVALLGSGAGADDGVSAPASGRRRRASRPRARAGAFGARDARRLVAAAAAIPYTERTWRKVLAAAEGALAPAATEALAALVRSGAPDPKAEDARATLRAAAAFARAQAAPVAVAPRRWPASRVRVRKLLESVTSAGGRLVPSAAVLDALRAMPDAAARADDGLRRLLLAAMARGLGLRASDAERARAARDLCVRRGLPPGRWPALLAAAGLDGADAARLLDDLALERCLLDRAVEAVADGPSRLEGLARAARLDGTWAELAAALARPGAPAYPPRRRRR